MLSLLIVIILVNVMCCEWRREEGITATPVPLAVGPIITGFIARGFLTLHAFAACRRLSHVGQSAGAMIFAAMHAAGSLGLRLDYAACVALALLSCLWCHECCCCASTRASESPF
jgi:hypothetical protein